MDIPSPHVLADSLVDLVVAELDALVAGPFADWQAPSVFGGHRVGSDVSADLLFTLAHLRAAGVSSVAGTPIDDAVRAALAGVHPHDTHTFSSYRVAETLAQQGGFDGNPLLVGFDAQRQAQLASALDSTDWVEMLDTGLPRNYAAVLARCEIARQRLGLVVDDAVVDDLLTRVRDLLSAHPAGFHDDSDDGSGRFDIYTADLYLFCEPFADRLGDAWDHGVSNALDLVARTVRRNGAGVSWGRSTGALSLCLTVELAALALRHDPDTRQASAWLERAAVATDELRSWFDRGVITAHRHRSPYGYRGPQRRLQMTLDALGKLAWAAGVLAASISNPPIRTVDDPRALTPGYPGQDELISFETSDTAGLWCFRDTHNDFVLPLVGGARSDYLAAPSDPGRYEVPVDRSQACWLPTVFVDDTRFTATGRPSSVEHEPAKLTLSWDVLGELPSSSRTPAQLAGSFQRTVHVDGRSLLFEDHLSLDPFDASSPPGVSLAIPESDGRPLAVEVTSGDSPQRQVVVDTDGIKEWRSFWGPLPRLHELTWTPAQELAWSVRVTPAIRVASEAAQHHYHRSLYDPMGSAVVDRQLPHHAADPDAVAVARALRNLDVFHLHWPEWFVGEDVERLERFFDALDEQGVALVWTQHNLQPHFDLANVEALYSLAAQRADGVIHHSEWGMTTARARWPYGSNTLHRVIPHGHFANLLGDWGDAERSDARARGEAELGLAPCALRIGIVGAPRADKDVVGFAAAFAACDRDDLGLVVLSARPEELEQIPDDPRICALAYEFVDRRTYNQRLATIDVLAMPFAADGTMLTTGVIGDAVGLGLGVLCTSWPYLLEMLGDAALSMGDTFDEHVESLNALDLDSARSAAAAAVSLRQRFDWGVLARQTAEFFDAVLGSR